MEQQVEETEPLVNSVKPQQPLPLAIWKLLTDFLTWFDLHSLVLVSLDTSKVRAHWPCLDSQNRTNGKTVPLERLVDLRLTISADIKECIHLVPLFSSCLRSRTVEVSYRTQDEFCRALAIISCTLVELDLHFYLPRRQLQGARWTTQPLKSIPALLNLKKLKFSCLRLVHLTCGNLLRACPALEHFEFAHDSTLLDLQTLASPQGLQSVTLQDFDSDRFGPLLERVRTGALKQLTFRTSVIGRPIEPLLLLAQTPAQKNLLRCASTVVICLSGQTMQFIEYKPGHSVEPARILQDLTSEPCLRRLTLCRIQEDLEAALLVPVRELQVWNQSFPVCVRQEELLDWRQCRTHPVLTLLVLAGITCSLNGFLKDSPTLTEIRFHECHLTNLAELPGGQPRGRKVVLSLCYVPMAHGPVDRTFFF